MCSANCTYRSGSNWRGWAARYLLWFLVNFFAVSCQGPVVGALWHLPIAGGFLNAVRVDLTAGLRIQYISVRTTALFGCQVRMSFAK